MSTSMGLKLPKIGRDYTLNYSISYAFVEVVVTDVTSLCYELLTAVEVESLFNHLFQCFFTMGAG